MTKVTDVRRGTPDFPEIREFYEEFMHPDRLNFDDRKVYEYVFHAGRWAGIFQATQRPTQKFFERCKPTSVTDLAAITSIWRPGPLAGKMHELYVDAKFKKPYDWGHPLINEVLSETYGLLVFQESMLALANRVAGYDLAKTDQVRRAILKRSLATGEAAKKEAAELRDSFIGGCVSNGVPRSIAEKLYDNILAFGGYAFNKCVHSSEECKIVTQKGDFQSKRLDEVSRGDTVVTFDERLESQTFTEVTNIHDNGTLDLVEVELTTGEKIQCTINHRFRTEETREMLPLWLIVERGLSIVVDTVTSDTQTQLG